MYHEQRLCAIGWPLEDALSVCYYFPKEGIDLDKFIEQEEEKYRKANAEYMQRMIVREMMG